MSKKEVKETLLGLNYKEKRRRKKAAINYAFFNGASKDLRKAMELQDPVLLGQNWLVADKLDYKPTQLIVNKVKPILNKQARWMFGKKPDILITPDTKDENMQKLCDDLKKYLDNILDYRFWNETKQAFLLSTITGRVSARVSAIPEINKIKVRYDGLEDISYKEIDGEVTEVKCFLEDSNNATIEDESKRIYYIYHYFYDCIEEENIIKGEKVKRKVYKPSCEKLTYKGDNLTEPIKTEEEEVVNNAIGLNSNKLPCWIIKNNPSINNRHGQSDLEDIKDLQNERNRRISDNQDAIKFNQFGAVSVLDGKENTEMAVAPGALWNIKTDDEAKSEGKQAQVQVHEFGLGNDTAVQNNLNLLDDDMRDIMDIPKIKDLSNVSSSKAMQYLCNDLIVRCEDKWNDWTPYFLELIEYIINISVDFNLKYWNPKFIEILDVVTIRFKHNYPIPQDVENEKTIAMQEVDTGVRSKKSYIRDFSKDEDAEKSYKEILEEKQAESDISLGSLNMNTGEDGNNEGEEDEE